MTVAADSADSAETVLREHGFDPVRIA
jgi:hypothetical protein